MSTTTTRIPGTRNLSGTQVIHLGKKAGQKYIGTTLDMSDKAWGKLARATGIKAGRYTAERYFIGGDKSRPSIVLIPADKGTTDAARLKAARRAVDKYDDKAWIAAQKAAAQKRLETLEQEMRKAARKGKAARIKAGRNGDTGV